MAESEGLGALSEVERVAEAMYAAEPSALKPDWPRLSEPAKEEWRNRARAALAAADRERGSEAVQRVVDAAEEVLDAGFPRDLDPRWGKEPRERLRAAIDALASQRPDREQVSGEAEVEAAIDWIERALAAEYTDGDNEGSAALETALDSLRASRQERPLGELRGDKACNHGADYCAICSPGPLPADRNQPEGIWYCKIGEAGSGDVPDGGDAPMCDAVERAYKRTTGRHSEFMFSGWSAELTESERAVVENRLPASPLPAGGLTREQARLAQDFIDEQTHDRPLTIEEKELVWALARLACAPNREASDE